MNGDANGSGKGGFVTIGGILLPKRNNAVSLLLAYVAAIVKYCCLSEYCCYRVISQT